MKQKYNDNFINKTTGEVEKRTQFGEFGNIWLCETEYIEYNKDNIPMSYFYLKSWISCQSQWRYE